MALIGIPGTVGGQPPVCHRGARRRTRAQRRPGLTLASRGADNAAMEEAPPHSAIDVELKRLEKRLEELVAVVEQLKDENRALRQRQDALAAERSVLLAKNEQVRARVEAMVGRLKAMESNA
jgi:cell division protein ZapB